MGRVAAKDDVIPLEYPITTTTGKQISTIPVAAGQAIMLNVAVYNRYDHFLMPGTIWDVTQPRIQTDSLAEVWGPDAHEWNPMRHIENRVNTHTRLGMFGNL